MAKPQHKTGRCPFCERNDIKVTKATDDNPIEAANYRLKKHDTKKGNNIPCSGEGLPPSVLT